MKRYNLSIGDIAAVIKKSYPTAHQKINRKVTDSGKASLFDVDEAKAIVDFVVNTERDSLKERFADKWEIEWEKRWGHIEDWFMYIFFDEVVSNEVRTNDIAIVIGH